MPDISHLHVVDDWDDPNTPRDLHASMSRHPAYRARSAEQRGRDAERAAILAYLDDEAISAEGSSDAALTLIEALMDDIASGVHRGRA